MNNVIEFPGKDERQWRDVAEGLENHLLAIGAKAKEIPIVLERLRPRFEDPGWQPTLKPSFSHNVPGPLRQDQIDAIDTAMQEQSSEIARLVADHYKKVHTVVLLDFAKLELDLLRANPSGAA